MYNKMKDKNTSEQALRRGQILVANEEPNLHQRNLAFQTRGLHTHTLKLNLLVALRRLEEE